MVNFWLKTFVLTFIIILFISVSFTETPAQINSTGNTKLFSGNIVTSATGRLTFGKTDYQDGKFGLGGLAMVEYFLPTIDKYRFGTRLMFGGQNILGDDSRKNPESIRTDMYLLGFGLVLSYSVEEKYFPFLYGGISNLWFSPKFDDGKIAPNNNLGLYQKSTFSIDGNMGIRYMVHEIISLNFSTGLHIVQTDYLDDIELGEANDFYISLNFGVSVLLSGNNDSDDDGILNDKDICPEDAEDIDGFEDEDGCPDIDNDRDGIVDEVDSCPNEKEDLDGFEDDDGCPELDNDQDGIWDENDTCPNDAEDIDNFEDDDGCPELDNDGDRIPDSTDMCPNDAEDIDGFSDSDGCPDLDNDDDGIPDLKDKCPEKAEDIDQFEDDDGCPDEDNDNDGILDIDDNCINEPETFNQYQDDDGCPDALPANFGNVQPSLESIQKSYESKSTSRERINLPDEILINSGILFSPGSSTIKKESYPELDRVVKIIKNFPLSRWRIEAYMDNQGDPGEILNLTSRRATAIQSFFVLQGLLSSQFESIGMGDKYPIADNNSPRGRITNRRIAIVRIK